MLIVRFLYEYNFKWPDGSIQGGVADCSCALVKIVKSSRDRCLNACRHKYRIGLSVGTLVFSCSE